MLVGAKVCDLTEDLLWFVCGNFDVFPNFQFRERSYFVLPFLERKLIPFGVRFRFDHSKSPQDLLSVQAFQ